MSTTEFKLFGTKLDPLRRHFETNYYNKRTHEIHA